MTTTVRDVMSTDLVTCPADTTIADAARLMRDRDIGDVLVIRDDDRLIGIVTDRDLVVRCLAERAPSDDTIEQACSGEPVTLEPDCDIIDAELVMRAQSIRRVPVVEDGRVIGIVTLGDLAIQDGPASTLGDISASPPDR